jgi:CRISPR-associated Csx14 family protein
MATVLIASLGDSPVVVTAMFDLLRQERNIDQLKVFYTNDSMARIGYEELIYEALQHQCEMEGVPLATEDMSSEEVAYDFLRQLSVQLKGHQDNGDTVILSLAGGRKSMAALMALLAPLFSCVEKLYHILDLDEGKEGSHLWTTSRLWDLPTQEDRMRHLFPSHKRVKLIAIPYEPQVLISEIYTITPEQNEKLWEHNLEEAKTITYYRDGCKFITVELTKETAEEYREMWKFDVTRAKNFAKCFDQMHFAVYLDQNSHDIKVYKGQNFHYYKRPHTAERPVFHTEPQDIKADPDAYIHRVVVSALPIEVEERYPRYTPLKEIVKKLKFPLETEKLEAIRPQEKELILIIPLGTSPMVATQLYQLYKNRGDTVHSIILVHTQHKEVCESVRIACDAFAGVGIDCKPIPLKGWEDIDTTAACTAYQELLEKTIQDTCQHNPSCQIELTISGGRKGMAALATFAAQNLGIHHVVHTVIHERLSDTVYEQTTIEELQRLENTNYKAERDDRLFLRAYEDKDAFVLFNIPVLPVQKG